MHAFPSGMRPWLPACLALALLTPGLPTRAADNPERTPAPVCVTESASLLRRPAPDKPWQVVKEGEELFAGDAILGSSNGAVDSRNGAVRLAVVGDVDGTAPLPILETAFTLREAKDVDFDVQLDRGRVRLINLKKEGAARVRLRVQKTTGEVVLEQPGSTLSIEIYGRWPRGVPFRKEPKAGEEPAQLFTLLAVKGDIGLKGERRNLTLKAPPGLALLEGNTLEHPEPEVAFLKELPPWAPERLADLGNSEAGKKMAAVRDHVRRLAIEKGVPGAVGELLRSDDPAARRYAILLLAATDDLAQMGDILKNTTHQDVWDAGIIALRHWIGRGPGQDQKLYQGLIDKAKLPPREAEGVLQLLHSFGEADLARPETLQALVNYLGSDRVSLRQLAYWHLQRLVPAGRKIDYEPLAAKEKRDAAVKEWRKLVAPPEPPPGPDDK